MGFASIHLMNPLAIYIANSLDEPFGYGANSLDEPFGYGANSLDRPFAYGVIVMLHPSECN